MPYIIIRGNLASYDNKYPWRVLVSGLKSDDIEGLRIYPCGGYCDECTIVYLQHPCVILSALEKLGYQIVASSSTSVKQDYNEYVWTMRRALDIESDGDSVSQTTYVSNMSHAHCCKSKASSALAQSLDEMEFERGIWSAANDGDVLKVQNFLKKNVSADIRDAAGYTALHYAALKGYTDICKLLLRYGADINAVTRAGKASALHRAATGGRIETVEFLVNQGACVMLQDADGQTALHRAVLNRRRDVVELLSTNHPNLLSITDHKHKLAADYRLP